MMAFDTRPRDVTFSPPSTLDTKRVPALCTLPLVDAGGREQQDGCVQQQDVRPIASQVPLTGAALCDLVLSVVRGIDLVDRRLVRLSLTTPDDFGPVGRPAREYLAILEADGDSAIMLVDKRDDSSEHLYGFALTGRTKEQLVAEWARITGASLRWQLAGEVHGWRAYAERLDAGILAMHLGRACEYACKPWPLETGRRGPGDVYAVGGFSALMARPGAEPARTSVTAHPRSNGAPVTPEPSTGRTAVTRAAPSSACAVCGRSLDGKRADAATCEGRCRVRLHRSRKRVPK
jgi:hypothetical protein